MDSTGTKSATLRETEFNKVITKLHEVTDQVSKKFEELNSRLSPILRNEPSNTGDDQAGTPEFNTKVAQDINSIVRQLDILSYRIDQTLNQLEL